MPNKSLLLMKAVCCGISKKFSSSSLAEKSKSDHVLRVARQSVAWERRAAVGQRQLQLSLCRRSLLSKRRQVPPWPFWPHPRLCTHSVAPKSSASSAHRDVASNVQLIVACCRARLQHEFQSSRALQANCRCAPASCGEPPSLCIHRTGSNPPRVGIWSALPLCPERQRLHGNVSGRVRTVRFALLDVLNTTMMHRVAKEAPFDESNLGLLMKVSHTEDAYWGVHNERTTCCDRKRPHQGNGPFSKAPDTATGHPHQCQ